MSISGGSQQVIVSELAEHCGQRLARFKVPALLGGVRRPADHCVAPVAKTVWSRCPAGRGTEWMGCGDDRRWTGLFPVRQRSLFR